MPDQVPDSGQGQPGAEAVATPTFQDVPVVAGLEKTFDKDALVSEIVERIGPEIDKRFQSAKDKRLSTLDKLGGGEELLKLVDYIKANGGDADKGLKQYQQEKRDATLDALAVQLQQGSLAPAASRPAVDQASVQKRTAEILTEAGIDFKDPEYIALASKSYASAEAFYDATTRFAIRRAKQAIQPGAASVSAAGGQPPVTGDRETELNKLYSELAQAQQTNNRVERLRLTQKIKALGGIA